MSEVSLFIAEQPEVNRTILYRLQEIIVAAAPQIEEKISYKIPFYYYYGRLCYLNPHRHGVDIGFCRGFTLANEAGLLQSKNRTQVKTITYTAPMAITEKPLREIVQEALIVNEWYFRHKKATSL